MGYPLSRKQPIQICQKTVQQNVVKSFASERGSNNYGKEFRKKQNGEILCKQKKRKIKTKKTRFRFLDLTVLISHSLQICTKAL